MTAISDTNTSYRIGMAFLACGILTFISFFAIVILAWIPLFRRAIKSPKQILIESLFFAFAIGVLLGTTVFHLIPEVFGIDLQHHSEESSHDHSHDENSCNLSSRLGTLSIAMGLILILVYDSFFRHAHSHDKPIEKTTLAHPNDVSDSPPVLDDTTEITIDLSRKVDHCELDTNTPESQERHVEQVEPPPKPDQILAFGWSALFSELLHNLVDGILIGITFQVSSQAGWSNAIASFAHEFPQELCDFFILKAAGFSTIKIIIYNVIVSLSSFVGVALTLFDISQQVTQFVIGLVGGSFLGITLVQLWPQLKEQFGFLEGSLNVYCKLGSLFFGTVGTTLILLMSFYFPHEHNESC